MPGGFDSIHPRMAAALRELGVKDAQITQGWGYAKASAGYHAPEGRTARGPEGHPFSSCVDLSFGLASRSFVDRLMAAGFCPFVREHGKGWSGSSHLHCVYIGARDWQGRVTILPGPRMQIMDFLRGGNGLVNHEPIVSYPPSHAQRTLLGALYAVWAPSVATRVTDPEGVPISCYAFLEREAVRCEARPFLEHFGAEVCGMGAGLRAWYQGADIDLTGARPKLAGEFTRADVRGLATALRLEVEFAWSENGTSAEVRVRE